MMAALYLTLARPRHQYYGEELGNGNTNPKSKDEVQDADRKTGLAVGKSRDGERTPMHWKDGRRGFQSRQNHGWPFAASPNWTTWQRNQR